MKVSTFLIFALVYNTFSYCIPYNQIILPKFENGKNIKSNYELTIKITSGKYLINDISIINTRNIKTVINDTSKYDVDGPIIDTIITFIKDKNFKNAIIFADQNISYKRFLAVLNSLEMCKLDEIVIAACNKKDEIIGFSDAFITNSKNDNALFPTLIISDQGLHVGIKGELILFVEGIYTNESQKEIVKELSKIFNTQKGNCILFALHDNTSFKELFLLIDLVYDVGFKNISLSFLNLN